MQWVQAFLAKYPELAVYLAIAMGYLIGGIKIGEVGLGPVTGSLFAGLLIGQFADVPVSSMAKSFLFLLFLFGIGYSVGPAIRAVAQAGRSQASAAGLCGRASPVCFRDSGGKIARARPGLRGGAGLRRPDGKPRHGHRYGGDQRLAAAGSAARSLRRPYRGRRRGLLPVRRSLRDPLLQPTWSGASEVDLKRRRSTSSAQYGIERTKAGLFSAWRRFELRAYRVAGEFACCRRCAFRQPKRSVPDHRLFVQRHPSGATIL